MISRFLYDKKGGFSIELPKRRITSRWFVIFWNKRYNRAVTNVK